MRLVKKRERISVEERQRNGFIIRRVLGGKKPRRGRKEGDFSSKEDKSEARTSSIGSYLSDLITPSTDFLHMFLLRNRPYHYQSSKSKYCCQLL
jgi:hypothetical protein